MDDESNPMGAQNEKGVGNMLCMRKSVIMDNGEETPIVTTGQWMVWILAVTDCDRRGMHEEWNTDCRP